MKILTKERLAEIARFYTFINASLIINEIIENEKFLELLKKVRDDSSAVIELLTTQADSYLTDHLQYIEEITVNEFLEFMDYYNSKTNQCLEIINRKYNNEQRH